jgi:zinc protease
VLSIVGDVKPTEAFARVEKYFGQIPSRPTPPRPDVSEGPNTAERTLEQTDPLAKVPALAVGWKMPPRGSRDQTAAAVLGELLVGGDASRFYQAFVKGKEILLNIEGGLNWPLGSPWTYDGPTLLTLFALYKPTTNAQAVAGAMDEEIRKIVKNGVSAEELARTKTKMVSNLYSELELPLHRAQALCLAQAFAGSAASVNERPGLIEAVTSADLQRVAGTYLTKANRTLVDRKPAASAVKN